MDWLKAALLTGLLSAPLIDAMPQVAAADRGRGNSCQRGDRLHIEDLDISPDPVFEGQPIRSFRVRLRSDGKRACEATVSIRESGRTIGLEQHFTFRPGINEIDLRPADGYRFRGREHCLSVEVDVEGSRREVDAARRFCARQRAVWSMREPDDRRFR